MVVDGEGGDLLDKLQQVDGAVEEGGLEFAFEIDGLATGFGALHVIGYVNERGDVDGELAENRADDVRVEDVGLGPFFG